MQSRSGDKKGKKMRIVVTMLTLGAGLALAACGNPQSGGQTLNNETTQTADQARDFRDLIRSEDLDRRIGWLADDAREGRAPATDGGRATTAWIRDELKAMGLEPAPGTSDFYQEVTLTASTVDLADSFLRLGASGAQKPLEYGPQTVFWTKKTQTPVAVENSELVFVGYGAVAPEYGWNDYEGMDFTGKTVVMLVNDPGYATGDPELFNGNAMTYYGRWTYKFEEAGRQGADAAIIIHETEPASYPWLVVASSWSGEQLDLVRSDGGANRVNLEGWITANVARDLFTDAGLDFEAMKEAAATRGFKPVPMGNLTLDARVKANVTTSLSNNVAGVLRGSERPDEHVLMTAHWDHIGKRDVPEGEDGIYNGAVDNATGVAGVLGILDAIAAGQRPERSILALFVTAEESGLLGSEFYAINPLVPLEDTVAGINIDGVLPGGRSRDMVVVGYGASELEEILEERSLAYGKRIAPDPNPEAGYFYRSDHVSLAKRGVPMLYADGGADLVDGGEEAGAAFALQYRNDRYHKPADEYDAASWNLEGMQEDLSILHDVVRELADSDEWPNWYADNEFRSLRDAQRAAN
jgi:Zn-dependent M28 family amino/carboxypeptidase